MVNRFPLIIDVSDKKLKELPIGDNLEVTNSIAFGNNTLSLNNGTIIINGNALIIPTDVSQLTDEQGLLGDGIVNESSFSRLTKLSTVERDQLLPETGDIIYNTTESTIQSYVDISDWSLDLEPQPLPGWISLYTPPLPPA